MVSALGGAPPLWYSEKPFGAGQSHGTCHAETWYAVIGMRSVECICYTCPPGNLLVLSDGRVGFIDFGIVGRISKPTWIAI